jgi:hypothetical protein
MADYGPRQRQRGQNDAAQSGVSVNRSGAGENRKMHLPGCWLAEQNITRTRRRPGYRVKIVIVKNSRYSCPMIAA